MKWLIKVDDKTLGPVEENAALELLRAHPTAQVRGEGGGAWMEIADSPFANHFTPMTSVSRNKPAAPSGGVPTKYKLAILAVVLLFLWAMASNNGWIGIVMGVGLCAWTVQRHRKGDRSLLSLALNREHGLVMTGATGLIALSFAVVGINGLISTREREKAAEVAHAAAQQRQEAFDARQAQLRTDLPNKVTAWRDALTRASNVSDSTPASLQSAVALIQTMTSEMADASKLLGAPSQEMQALQAEGNQQLALLEARAKLPSTISDVATAITDGKAAAQKRAWLQADTTYDEALTKLSAIESQGPALSKYLPPDFSVSAQRAEITKLKAAIATPVGQEKKRVEREEKKRLEAEQKQAAYAAVCGEAPLHGGFDGEVAGLESTIARTAHDPDSIDVENCTKPQLTTDNCWQFTCDVRGKNAFGALILNRNTYYYSKMLGFSEKKK